MIFAANFKCNHTPSSIYSYFCEFNTFGFSPSFLAENEIIFFPPFIGLERASELATFATIGAQNAYPAYSGAFSGEVGLAMLESLHIRTILIGHSERRNLLGESQAFCAQKFAFFATHHLRIVYCIGESLATKDKGKQATQDFLASQFEGIDTDYENLIVAYEPIWAIGTGVSATHSDIQEAHSFLRTICKAPLLYGGSVNANNATEILSIPNVDGLLVGSASLKANDFYTITQIKESK